MASMPHMELVAGGAQVEAAAHRAIDLLDSAIVHADSPGADPTVAAELVEVARDVLATGLGLPRSRQSKPWSVEEEGDYLADEGRIERRAA